VRIDLAGRALELLPERAVWWPALRTAVVADVHLGKDQVFRRAGVPIPSSVLDAELAELDALIARTGCERLLVLGDWVHAPPGAGDRWPATVRGWRERHGQLAVGLVPGNHDRRLEAWLAEWRIDLHPEPLELDGLALLHESGDDVPPPGLSGHLHPVTWLRWRRERVRLPVFARSGDHVVLPAFGRFTGGYDGLDPKRYALYAIAGRRVFELSSRANRRLQE
jgi:DNA ligase-associated metallophosphoesterase